MTNNPRRQTGSDSLPDKPSGATRRQKCPANTQATNGSGANATARQRKMGPAARWPRRGRRGCFSCPPIFNFQFFAPSLPVGAVIGRGCCSCSPIFHFQFSIFNHGCPHASSSAIPPGLSGNSCSNRFSVILRVVRAGNENVCGSLLFWSVIFSSVPSSNTTTAL